MAPRSTIRRGLVRTFLLCRAGAPELLETVRLASVPACGASSSSPPPRKQRLSSRMKLSREVAARSRDARGQLAAKLDFSQGRGGAEGSRSLADPLGPCGTLAALAAQ